jgi:class 3 adenylate cyclase
MTLRHQFEDAAEPRYDAETLRKVTALAQRLKTREQETFTAGEIEAIGGEVGLETPFIRRAFRALTEGQQPVTEAVTRMPPRLWRTLASAWWAGGWTVPFILMGIPGAAETPAAFFMGWGVYIGLGVLFQGFSREEKERGMPVSGGPLLPPAPLSRAALLDTLFAIQRQLEGQKRRRAFLSLDVVGSSRMKLGAPDLAVEHSFGQLRAWLEGIVRAHGGELHGAAGDGIMCVFPDEHAALRAARQAQEGLPAFNAERNALDEPFRLRCGVTAGEVALEDGAPLGHANSAVIDRAAALQKHAAPGDIVVGAEAAAAGLVELGRLAPLAETVLGERAFSWQAAVPRS